MRRLAPRATGRAAGIMRYAIVAHNVRATATVPPEVPARSYLAGRTSLADSPAALRQKNGAVDDIAATMIALRECGGNCRGSAK
jgi:hypothetical protein